MDVPEAFRVPLADGDLEALEELWLAELALVEPDAAGLAAVGIFLRQEDRGETAEFLLELLDDHLRDHEAWSLRLDLLRAAGPMIVPVERLHGEILATLRHLYAGGPHLEALMERVGLHRACDDIPKSWTKVDRLCGLMAYVEGTAVWMEGKGAGRVTEVNLQLEVFRVELAGGATLSVGFAAAGKLLHPLPPGHVLRRKLEEPEALRRLKDDDPHELLRATLESFGEPQTANDLRQALEGIVGDKEWSSFWNRVRRNPQLVALPGGRARYRWASSAGEAVTELAERFADAPLDERLELLRTHADRHPQLKETMVSSLREEADRRVDQEAPTAFTIGLALERAGAADPDARWSPARLLGSCDDAARFAAGLKKSSREEAFRMLPGARSDWAEAFAAALRQEEDPRLLTFLAETLTEAAPELARQALGELFNRPRQNPGGFTWLAERAAQDEALLRRRPLRLFQQILAASGDERFGAQRRRLLALAESGGTLPRLLPHLEADQAPQAVAALDRAAGLAEHDKAPLRNALHLRFPDLDRQRETPLYATPEAIARKRRELEELARVEIPANRKAIEEAREHGDLRENFEYKSARQRHEYLSARATALHQDLGRARPIDPATIDPSAVRVGTRVSLGGPDGASRSFTILGPWESDPAQGVLSNESELAERLLGMEPGDDIDLEGATFRVTSIERFR